MIRFSILPEIRDIFPDLHVGLFTGTVVNTNFDKDIWQEIDAEIQKLSAYLTLENIREIEHVSSGKKAYRLLGKDPNRYRISAEALLRRIAKGGSIYQINSLVDILNLVSIRTGITIGGFDCEKVRGQVSLGIGMENEEFEAIGRGMLNIHRLPVYRDKEGAIGSPTSDCVRTMMRPETEHFLMIITGFFGENGINDCISQLKALLKKYIYGRNFDIRIEN